MTFIQILESIGAKITDIAPWIEEGLTVAAQIAGKSNPSLADIFIEIEEIFANATQPVTAAQVQGIVSSVATNEALKAVRPKT